MKQIDIMQNSMEEHSSMARSVPTYPLGSRSLLNFEEVSSHVKASKDGATIFKEMKTASKYEQLIPDISIDEASVSIEKKGNRKRQKTAHLENSTPLQNLKESKLSLFDNTILPSNETEAFALPPRKA